MKSQPLAVALFNDTASAHHTGCLAVSRANRLMLRRAGAVVRHAYFVHELMHLGTGSVADGIARALACHDLRRTFAEVDAVVVNGEGTIHDGCGRHLLAILGAAQRCGLPTFLVNAVLQNVQDGLDVLRAVDDCTVREARTASYLASLRIPHRVVVDSLFEADFVESPHHDFAGKLIVTDCHSRRAAEFAPQFEEIRALWGDRVADYALQAPERVHDWQHAVADFRPALGLVTGRHHGVCIALRAGIPFIAFPSNTWKIEGVIEMLDGYPAAAADPSRPISERLEAALAARDWFRDQAAKWNREGQLDTFAGLRRLATRAIRSSVAVRAAVSTPEPRVVAAVRAIAAPGRRVLHAGAGDGAMVRALLSEAIDAHGVDVSARSISALNERFNGRFHSGTPASLPFDDCAFGTVVVDPGWIEHLERDEIAPALAELARVTSDAVVVGTTGRPFRADVAANATRPRAWWEQALFEAGLRRHTRLFEASSFEALEDEHAACLVMQKLPATAALAHPLASLAAERDLHMDMLRETGRRSDAHLARYEWARQWIKPGDVVVDAACGLGYGSAVLWDGSEAARVVGLDITPHVVQYARDCFLEGRPGLEFRVADAEGWDGWDDHSVDCIVSFETIEHLRDPQRFMRGVKRVLKPGGRFLGSIPNEWLDETGRDPNPYHLHVFDLDRLVDLVSSELLVDEAYAQSAGGHAERFEPRRMLRAAGWPEVEASFHGRAEWWLITAVKDPLAADAPEYVETVFPAADAKVPNAIAFARDYVNPWAVHAVVLGTYRVRSARLLHTLAKRWLEASPVDSADAGAALCVLAYRALDVPPSDDGDELLARIAAYRALPRANPQVLRWQVSLAFVEGLWRMRCGELAAAEACLNACAASAATAFTPHLETKTTEAAWLAGRLALERGDRQAAAAQWRQAFAALDRLRTTSSREWLLSPDRPSAFEFGDGLREIAVAVDNAALAANGLRALNDVAGAWRPGARSIDRNFQRNLRRLLDVVDERGGAAQTLQGVVADLRRQLDEASRYIASLTSNLEDVVRQRDQAVLAVRAELSGLSRLAAERAVLLSSVRRRMERVVVVGAGAAGQRVWEAIVRYGHADVIAFVDSDERRYPGGRLGLPVEPLEWLKTARFDRLVTIRGRSSHVDPILAVGAVPQDAVIELPADADDETLNAAVMEAFADPLRPLLEKPDRTAGLSLGVFGTGAGAMRVWEALADNDDVSVVWFTDNNPKQHGQQFLWVPVIPPDAIASQAFDAIVVGSMARDPISQQLIALGIDRDRILTPNVTRPIEELRQELEALLLSLGKVTA